jgi:hypothetical protein
MTSVQEHLYAEIEKICDKAGHSRKTKVILSWFADECMTSGSRIERSELKAQLLRLGKELQASKE